MKFSVHGSLAYQVFDTSTVICSLNCSRSDNQKILEESFTTSRSVERSEMSVGLDANRLMRLDITKPGPLLIDYEATVSLTPSLVKTTLIENNHTSAFEATALPYLAPSRYVPSDRMRNFAGDLFGFIDTPLNQALAIEEWLYQHIQYQIGSSDEQSWSIDTFESRTGVCRDFAHLGIAFCRALNIPARYVTVYAYQLIPQDFHAAFEVFIGGQWWLFDGTRLAPLNGMIRIATGRDAAETALGSLFGAIQGEGVIAATQLANDAMDDQTFTPLNRDSLRSEGLMLHLG